LSNSYWANLFILLTNSCGLQALKWRPCFIIKLADPVSLFVYSGGASPNPASTLTGLSLESRIHITECGEAAVFHVNSTSSLICLHWRKRMLRIPSRQETFVTITSCNKCFFSVYFPLSSGRIWPLLAYPTWVLSLARHKYHDASTSQKIYCQLLMLRNHSLGSVVSLKRAIWVSFYIESMFTTCRIISKYQSITNFLVCVTLSATAQSKQAHTCD
jgi:hypothetical protein